VPRLKISSRIDLKEKLSTLGMPDIFTGKADFSGITGTTDLFLNPYIQQASLTTIDKRLNQTSDNPTTSLGQLSFVAQRPFIFAVLHKSSGVILMLGKFSN
jgi:serine protease inhibitor